MKKLVFVPFLFLSINSFASLEQGSFSGRTQNGVIKKKCEINIELVNKPSSRMSTSRNVYVMTVSSGNYSESFEVDADQDFSELFVGTANGDDNNFRGLEVTLDSIGRPTDYIVKSFNGAFGIGRTKTVVSCLIDN